MTLPFILVTDTNIWIDLENGGILKEVFHLPYRFVVPNLAIPEFVSLKWNTLQSLGVTAQELSPKEVQELFNLRPFHMRLSVPDLARANHVAVHGVLWLLDEMVNCSALLPAQAAGR